MKIWVLAENTAISESLTAEHGLSLYIETGSHRILFDTGKTGAFADNAEKMGVDLRDVDFCILSHGHYDHGGGLKRFLEINTSAPVYASSHAFLSCFSSGNYIGLNPELEGNPRILSVGDDLQIAPGITLHTGNALPRPHAFGVFGQTILQKGTHVPDPYLHEQYLLIEEAGKRICISGCSHKGVRNILHWFRPDVFLGGFHFMKMDPQGEALALAAEDLLARPTVYYTGHCTGLAQYDALKQKLGSRLEYLHTGTVLTL